MLLDSVPPGVTTWILPVVAPMGTVVVISEGKATLNEAGVPCEMRLVEAAYHGFDAVSRKAPVSQAFRASYLAALKQSLCTAQV